MFLASLPLPHSATAHSFVPFPSLCSPTPFAHTIGAIVTMATASPLAALVNSLTEAPEEHVKELIKCLKALPQCNKNKTDSTSTTMAAQAAVKKSRSSKKDKSATKGPKRPLNSWMAYRSKLLVTLGIRLESLLTFLRVLQQDAQPTHSEGQVADLDPPVEGRHVRGEVVNPCEELQHHPWRPRQGRGLT